MSGFCISHKTKLTTADGLHTHTHRVTKNSKVYSSIFTNHLIYFSFLVDGTYEKLLSNRLQEKLNIIRTDLVRRMYRSLAPQWNTSMQPHSYRTGDRFWLVAIFISRHCRSLEGHLMNPTDTSINRTKKPPSVCEQNKSHNIIKTPEAR